MEIPSKRKCVKWTYERFITEASKIHGKQYDYSSVQLSDVVKAASKVKVKCNSCNNIWYPTVTNHIYAKSGCPICKRNKNGSSPWNLLKFIAKANEIHNDKYDYSLIKSEHIQGNESRVPIVCKSCSNQWMCMITNHIYKQSGCPGCSDKQPYTKDLFIKRAIQVYGDLYDYSEITDANIINSKSKVPVICKICGYKWNTIINNHINEKRGCPNCSEKAVWVLSDFIHIARSTHMNKYDYSLIKEEDIRGAKSKLKIKCNGCQLIFDQSIDNHINRKNGCPYCCRSHGEMECERVFQEMNISYNRQAYFETKPRWKYDYSFIYGQTYYVLKYDGQQHFQRYDRFQDEDAFMLSRKRDLDKTMLALQNGCNVIRIDYNQINNIGFHMINALKSNQRLYFSSPILYEWLISGIK